MKIKSQKGSITIFVLVALLFYTAFLLLMYAANTNKFKTISEKSDILKGIYEKNISDESINNLYNKKKAEYNPNFSNFQKVEYLESTGTQYIDTGVIPDSNTGFYLDFTLLDSVDNNGKRLLGTSYRNNGDWGGVMISSWNWSAGGQMNYMQRSRSYNPGLVTNTRMQISLINRHYQSSTGTNIEFQTGSLSDIYGSIYLLNVNTDMFNSNGSSAIIYSAKIYDGNNEIRNYIPCYRKADNKPGLYDLVNGEFYTNQGTGEFLAGPDVD